MTRGRGPSLPSGELYDNLVSGTAWRGWRFATAFYHSVSLATLKTWHRRAENGEEPYASWVRQFTTDVIAARRRLPSYDPRHLPPADDL